MRHRDGCPQPVKLLALVRAGEYVPHLRECEKCAKFVETAAEAVNAFRDRSELEDALSEHLDSVLAETYGHRVAAAISNATELHRGIVVRELLRRAATQRGCNPSRYRDLTTAATVVCDEMTAAGHPPEPELHIEALREQSAALRQLGFLEDAMKLLCRAAELVPRTQQPEFQRALLLLYTAIIDAEPDIAKFDEAVHLTEFAWAVLELCGDQRRAVLARQTKAYVLAVAQNQFTDALPLLRDVVAELEEGTKGPEPWASTVDLAVALASLAHCLIGLGSHEEAATAASRAERLQIECGRTTSAARAAHIRARAIASLGRFDDARADFNRAAEVVFDAKFFDEWSIMRLDYVAAALAADSDADVRSELISVARVCLTATARTSNVRQQYAAEAMAYLRTLAERDTVTIEAVDFVRAYVERNATRPPVKFAPPQGGTFLM